MADLKQVYRKESMVSGGFNISVSMDIGRPFNDNDYIKIQEFVDDLEKSILVESDRLSPDVQNRAKQEEREILSLFSSEKIFVEKIPNEYDPVYFSQFPWFLVTTKIGRIKIGRRKRVLQIDWSDSTIQNTSAELFPHEDTTKVGKMIHAWGYDKAKEYIVKLLGYQMP